jgi:hypothetical protein
LSTPDLTTGSPSPWAAPEEERTASVAPTIRPAAGTAEPATAEPATAWPGEATAWPGDPAAWPGPAAGQPAASDGPAPWPVAPPPGYQAPYGPAGGWSGQTVARPTNGMAIASLVLAVSGFAMCGVTGLVGAILGMSARKRIRETGEAGDGLALAGIIVGWATFALAIAIGVLYTGLLVVVFRHASDLGPRPYGN